MAKNLTLDATKLSLDLKNYRTVPQTTEEDAIKAMIAISPDRFFAVMDSVVDDGYTPTENIIILDDSGKRIVKEGNRRIACLKLIQGQYPLSNFNTIPSSIVDKIANLNKVWKKQNLNVPCIVFDKSEEAQCDRVVSLTHGKGEKANREKWSSVATARHNRDVNGVSEPGLNLLEHYLKVGNNLTNQQKERWAGNYPLTVLNEAIRLLYPRLGYSNANDLVKKYPSIVNLAGIEDLLRDIGLEQVTFKIMRDANTDFALNYNIAPITPPAPIQNPTQTPTPTPTPVATGANPIPSQSSGSGGSPSSQSGSSTPSSTGQSPTLSTQPLPPAPPAYALNDPKRVTAMLKAFNPKGNRAKVVTLRDEIKTLKLKNNPIAFCFILRSMFEISAKSYCNDNSIITTKQKKGNTVEKSLVELLTDVTNHLTNNNKNTSVVKVLHGSLTQLAKSDGLLSVTSMNSLVHNPSFSVSDKDVALLFGQVYPLLEYMN